MCQKLYPSSQQLISHLRVEHSYYPGPKFKLFCSQRGCRHQFLTYTGFRKHLNNVHSNVQQNSQSLAIPSTSSFNPVVTCQADAFDDQVTPLNQCCSSDSPHESTSSQISKDQTKEMCAAIVAKLQGNGISGSLVSSIVGDLEELTN